MNKITTLIAVSVLLLMISIILKYNMPDNVYTTMDQRVSHPYPFIKDSIESHHLGDDYTLHFVTDTADNIYYFRFIGKEVNFYGSLANLNDLGAEFYGINIQNNLDNNEDKLFIGMIANGKIETVTLNDSNENLQYFNYKGYSFVYSSTSIEEPFMIKGFSSDNQLIYEELYEGPRE
ncbi:hypothetical protein [Chengkuizengella axinellae]|uniref:DUF4367 domain-containing protein n=1 Tax=Chengkuizengella axinellae TaxID=3064388 RepID=A0ABT9IYU2_9BACL|nr:hypothetical protein [Chengkuizengella sp. 2205SS18-9]MDP5274523.1 hypothetical protein [Chengkuizengella sp. 2205SS18-9]